MKYLAIISALALSGCALSWKTASGDTFSVGFTPTSEQLDTLKGYAK
jgi:outer membrane lipoprotein SlyB